MHTDAKPTMPIAKSKASGNIKDELASTAHQGFIPPVLTTTHKSGCITIRRGVVVVYFH
jgi:hypothetical protein